MFMDAVSFAVKILVVCNFVYVICVLSQCNWISHMII